MGATTSTPTPDELLQSAHQHMYLHSRGDEGPEKAVALLEKAAEAGHTYAMSQLAGCYINGVYGVTRDLDKAERLCVTVGSSSGLWQVGCAHYFPPQGGGGCGNIDRAVSAWNKAVELGSEDAMAWLGRCYQHGVGVDRDPRRAVELYLRASATNRKYSWLAAVCFLRGEGVARDWARAGELLVQAYHAYEAVPLGWCYLWGCGVEERSVAMGFRLIREAVEEHNFTKAKVYLGCCFERGLGVTEDPNKACAWYDEAKSWPEGAEAFRELGEWFQRGDCGIPLDKRAAARYFEIGAEAGDQVSMFQLGVCLRDGDGVDRNAEKSHLWLSKAAERGHREAAKILLGNTSCCGDTAGVISGTEHQSSFCPDESKRICHQDQRGVCDRSQAQPLVDSPTPVEQTTITAQAARNTTETSVHTETNTHTTADPTLKLCRDDVVLLAQPQQPQEHDVVESLRQQVESLKASVGELTKQNEQLQCENRQCRANLKEALDCYQTISRNVSRLETLHQESIVAATSSLTATSTNHP